MLARQLRSVAQWWRGGRLDLPVIGICGRASLVAVGTALLVLPMTQPARAACSGLETLHPEVDVEVAVPREPSIVPASDSVIRSRAAATGNKLPEGAATRGLTVDRIEARVGVTLSKMSRGDEQCVALSAVHAEVASREVTVLIDHKYRPGTCQYDAILAHEREHVRINADALRDTGRLLEQRLNAVADRWSGRWLQADRQDEIQAEIDGATQTATREARAKAEERSGRIDTPQSYSQVQARCDSW